MPRVIVAVLTLLMCPLAASAQHGGHGGGGHHGGFGGGFHSGGAVMPFSVSPLPRIPPIASITPFAGFSGGFVRPGLTHHHRGVFLPGFGRGFGGFFPFYGYGYGYPYSGFGYGYGSMYSYPVFSVPVGPLGPDVQLSDQASAVLVLEFPAPAEVWLDGVKGEGEPHAEWTLTSPLVMLGTEYLFHVRARWTANGKTYEYDKTVSVPAGNRSRSLVISGTEIKQ